MSDNHTMTTTSSNRNKEKTKRKETRQSTERDKKSKTTKKQPLFESFDQIINKEQTNYKSSSKKDSKKRDRNSDLTEATDDKRLFEENEKKSKVSQKNSPHIFCEDIGSECSKKDEVSTKSSNDNDSVNVENDRDEESDGEKEIEEDVESDDSQPTANDMGKKENKKETIVTPHAKSSLQWFIRNVIFQKVKIVNDSHLESNGVIMNEIFDKMKIDKTSPNFNAYVNEIRHVVRRSISTRRGYVKSEIGKTMKRKS